MDAASAAAVVSRDPNANPHFLTRLDFMPDEPLETLLNGNIVGRQAGIADTAVIHPRLRRVEWWLGIQDIVDARLDFDVSKPPGMRIGR